MESNEDMWDLEYYHGLLPREDVEELLTKDGDFLVRKSEETSGTERIYVLSVNVAGQNRHAILRHRRGMIAVDFTMERGYRTIHRFVEVHLRAEDSISSEARVVIRRPIVRQKWELAHSTVTQGAELGRGAFGIVRRGTYKERGAQPIPVAIKEVSQTSTKEQIKEFMNEARIMRQFDHRNVIKFHGVAVGQEPLMIVMELATDGSLTDYLKKTRRSRRSKLYMCYGAAAGLDHIHSKGIIHCDIAARNCLFSSNSVKIADFGLAHKGKKKTVEPGKPAPIKWMSPESLSEKAFTQKSDTWSFGVLCWEIFNDGDAPYQNMTSTAVATMVFRGETLEFPESAPNAFADFVLKHVWDESQASRYSMSEVQSWLDRRISKLTGGSTKSEERHAHN
uniref:Tyrosine-protein kinase n=1 Tax=Globodera rostochiensis TaxID=31243 RepID=A0A914GRH5_GLORO